MDKADTINNEETTLADGDTDNKRRMPLTAAVAAAVLAVGVAASILLFNSGIVNPYEGDYVDVTGRTAADLAKSKNLSYSDFLKEYGLPEDMPKRTSERAVYYNIPVGKFVEKNKNIGTFEELKEQMGWDDTVTPETTIGDALDNTTLSNYVGDEQLERFKSLYELGDDVTGDTLYGEVRNTVDAMEKQMRESEQSGDETE